jgi:hypothetical protein
MENAGYATVTCAFCQGKGVDPYGPPARPARCEVCGGRGEVDVPVPHIVCAFCKGSGSPRTFRCPVCVGVGVLAPVPAPTRRCPVCQGYAMDPASGWPCPHCRGRGVIPDIPQVPALDESAAPAPVRPEELTFFAPSKQALRPAAGPGEPVPERQEKPPPTAEVPPPEGTPEKEVPADARQTEPPD